MKILTEVYRCIKRWCSRYQIRACLAICQFVTLGVLPQPHVVAESYQFSVTSDVFGEPRTIDFELVIPDDVSFVRGLAFNLSGRCGNWIGVFDETYQRAASAMDFGILTLDSGDLGWAGNPNCHFGNAFSDEDEPEQLLNAAVQTAAAVSGQPQLVNAPMGLIGYSMGGLNSLIIAGTAPERVLSISSVRGVTPPSPDPIPPGFGIIPGVYMSGSVDTIVSPASIEAGFDDMRSDNAEAAYVIHWTQGHSDNALIENGGQSVEMSWYWLQEAIRARYPNHLIPSTQPGNQVELVDIDVGDGWLADTPRLSPSFMASPYPEISPYSDYSGDPIEASWLPNEAVANVYRAFASYDPTRPNPQAPGQFLGSPLEFTSPRLFYSVDGLGQTPNYVVGDSIPVSVDPHEFDDVNSIVQMEFYNGDTLLGIDTSGPDWGTEFLPTEAGLHALVAVAVDDQGNRATNFRVVVIRHRPADFNHDGNLNGDDVDDLVAEISGMTHEPRFDLSGDGLVDGFDLDEWLTLAGSVNLSSGNAYRYGDANLDGVVDGLDFIEWNANKFTQVSAWTSGDFNADGVVDGQDFFEWNANKFTSADGVSAVPEPGMLVCALLSMVVGAVRRR